MDSRTKISRTGLAQRRRGFTLVEALVGISIVAIAGSVLLLAVESSLNTTWDAMDGAVASGLASQMLDEVMSKRYMADGESPTASMASQGASAYERSGSGRERYNDTDDYTNHSTMPLKGIWGETVGTGNDEGGLRHAAFRIPTAKYANWRRRVDVYYVDPSNHSVRLTSTTSNFRAVQVTVERVLPGGKVQLLATKKRVYAYLPPPS